MWKFKNRIDKMGKQKEIVNEMVNKEVKAATSKVGIKTVFEDFYSNNEGNDVTREVDEIMTTATISITILNIK